MDKLSYDYKDYSFPADWKEYKLSQVVKLVERPVDMEDDQEYDLITVKRNFGGIERRGNFLGKEILVKTQFKICKDDFVISKRQIVHGACAIVTKEIEGATVSNEYDVMNCINSLLPSFFNYYVQLPFMRRYFYIASDGVHIEKLRFKTYDWLRQKIRIPSVKEQQKIVLILGSWDKAIALEEQFIAQKKQQKKWLMQNLLTGEKLLSGFNGEWQEVRLGDIGKCIRGVSYDPKTDLYEEENEDSITLLRANNISEKEINYGELQYVNKMKVNEEQLLLENDIIIAMSSGSKKSVGKSALWTLMEKCYCVGAFCAIYRSTIPKYVIHFFESDLYNKQLSILLEGTNINNLKNSDIESLFLEIPINAKEQTAIAEILSTADEEIDLHEKQLNELKKQKKALMQLLLTGIVRVNGQEVS